MEMTQQYCIFDWFGYDIPLHRRYQLLREAGFNEVMLWWGDEFCAYYGDKKTYPSLAEQAGLSVRNVHFSYYDTNQLWYEGEAGEVLASRYRKWIKECAFLHIPTIVLHAAEGADSLPLSQIGLERFASFAEEAERAGIELAVENTKSIPHLTYLLDNIPSSALGLCFDSGHNHLIQPGLVLLEQYGHRLKALHLHDNHGLEDDHLLPGEGSIQWEPIVRMIRKSAYQGPLSLESAKPYPSDDGEKATAYLRRSLQAIKELMNLI